MIIFTKNVKKRPYLIGRFLGAFIFSALLFLTIGAGLGAASVVVGRCIREPRPSMITATWAKTSSGVADALLHGRALLHARRRDAGRWRRYVGAVVLVLGYVVAPPFSATSRNRSLAAMLDPFGFLPTA